MIFPRHCDRHDQGLTRPEGPAILGAVQSHAIGDGEVGVLARMLRGIEFFSPLTVGQLDQVLPNIRLFSYGTGETVFKQGEAGDAFYIVYKGKVTVRVKQGLFSFSKTVAALGQGAFFGEMALISRAPRSATVVCEEPSEIFVLVAGDFKFVLDQNPGAAAEMKRIAERRGFDTKHQ